MWLIIEMSWSIALMHLSYISFDSTHGSLTLKAYQQNLYLKYYY